MKKFLQIIPILGILLLTYSQSFAQRGMRGGLDIEKIKTELNLSDAQVNKVQEIINQQAEEMKALRDQDFESREDRRAAFMALRANADGQFKKVLTETQYQQMQEMTPKRGEGRRGGKGRKGHRGGKKMNKLNKADKEALKAEIEAYRKENILPVLLPLRVELDQKISAEDQATIAQMRVKKATISAEGKQSRVEMKEKRKELEDKESAKAFKKAKREEMKAKYGADREIMKGLVEKYKTDIKGLMARVETQRTQWRADQKAIYQKYNKGEKREGGEKKEMKEGKSHSKEHKGKGKRKGRHGKMKKGMKAGSFLLLDPKNPTAGQIDLLTTTISDISIYPNPGNNNTTIGYMVSVDGNVQIDLLNEQGMLLYTPVNAFHKAGQYKEQIDVSRFESGNYFITFIDASGNRVTEPFTLVK